MLCDSSFKDHSNWYKRLNECKNEAGQGELGIIAGFAVSQDL